MIPGRFRIEDDGQGDDDIVRLDPSPGLTDRTGWVNVGAFALHIEVDSDGDLKVTTYAAAKEDKPLASLQVAKAEAMANGAVDLDEDDSFALAAPDRP